VAVAAAVVTVAAGAAGWVSSPLQAAKAKAAATSGTSRLTVCLLNGRSLWVVGKLSQTHLERRRQLHHGQREGSRDGSNWEYDFDVTHT